MTALKMKVTIDEKPVSFSAIHSAELERTIAVASDLLQLIESDTELSHKVAPQLKSMHKLLEEKDASLEDLKNALVSLKLDTGTENMLALLLPETNWMSQKYNASNEKEIHYNLSQTTIEIEGLSAQQFGQFFAHQKASEDDNAIRGILIANPDHYVSTNTNPDGSGDQELIETMGMYEKPMRYILHTTTDKKDFPAPRLENYPIVLCVIGTDSQTGNYSGITAFHQFKPTEKGFIASLNLYFSDKFPAQLVEQHKMHLAIEFSNWIKAAYDEQNK
ncbi:hypothetical protein [Secundilactobacillus collinoides]|uniref:Uncharacterized protein n=2 Tax=Secundilactobacillus collinoides TaxID=33960 RepID=A0A0R2BA12_SECCO|nr:hypothetical protein [Secundilactobacillus collinoides]KRM75824.1 hypothetical protein FC82_GL001973 [Secundilactobacillus collinoides DSM 20515 = JCM 1123]KZL37180.1 hypothetical protein TY91_13225 [Secundilactobacillus collinoides]